MPDLSMIEKKLRDIIGDKYVSSELCDRLVYSKDYSIEGIADDYTPDIIVKPGTADEVAEVVKIANQMNVPIYTWGGGTSMSGNPLAVEHGIVLDMKRLNQVLEVDPDNLTITAQAGTTIENIYNAALDKGVFFAHHPESSLSSTIGGALSCMGISIYGAKYGYVYDQVLALEVILSDGQKIKIGGKSYLSLPTHNLLNLFLGAEGTLGIITEAILKVYPKPPKRDRVSYGFSDITTAIEACKQAHAAGCWPETVFLFDRRSLVQYMERAKTPIPDEVSMAVLFGASGNSEMVGTTLKVISKCSEEQGGSRLPSDLTQSWWNSINIGKDTFDQSNFALSHTEYEPDLVDACVPLSKFQEYSDFCDELKKEFGWVDIDFGAFIVGGPRGPIPFCIYFSVPIDTRIKAEIDKWFQFKERMYRRALEMGGSLSNANGLGLRSSPWVKDQLGPAWNLLVDLKSLLDPKNILNRGNRGFSS
ncbi:MAG: putative FAD-linked oxidoreductase [Candidatus Thorarchaeota archaeon AB_25]|nr:MAG: putative FAD-linked oxidoreductase [Candidatus Thorarchaeota archaeon AB_25]